MINQNITKRRVREVAAEYRMSIRWTDWGEWRITPQELEGARREAVAYYTDDNDDAVCTIVAMRRKQDAINAEVIR